MKRPFFKNNRGITLVEVLVASAIILSAVVTLIAVHSLYLRAAFTSANAMKAAYLLEEGIEAIRYMRDASWEENIGVLSIGTPYGIVFENGLWSGSTTAFMVDKFERTITLNTVYRDINGDIVPTPGTLDPGTLHLNASVSWWTGSATTTKSVSTYISNYYEN